MRGLLLSLGISSFAYAVGYYRFGHGLSPDGDYYLRAAQGEDVPIPYNRRLLPRLLGGNRTTWRLVSLLSLLATGPLVWLYTHSFAAVWLFSFLPMFHLNVRLPVLMDAPAFALALGAALALPHSYVAGIALSLAAGCCHERGPAFAALFAWSPWLLFGMLVPLAFAWAWKAPADRPWLSNPFKSARKTRDILDYRRMALPWGAIPLLLLWWNLQAAVTLAVGYAQILIAEDDSRLYQWSAPAVLALTPSAPWWLLGGMCLIQPFIVGAYKGGT